ncbi:EAL domain-containing protein [Pelagibacterium montanilacus]|uniref:EAL domain-containing protein n=1 Tax=Pelagibacterium montanilacus TaxID=2185280 RepID=UPI000F8E091E|nr:EAL domain-containing protein [Pelagibacterium montanilacus]
MTQINHFSGRYRLAHAVCAGLLALGIAWLVTFNVAAPIDGALSDWRFERAKLPASGDIIFVDIDGATLEAVGVWPWPRSIHARLIEKLLGAGAYDIWLDIDFSAASSPGEDASLADALAASGRYVYLAAFERTSPRGTTLTRPIAQLGAHADVFSVNAWTDRSGIVRMIPAHARDGDRLVPSLVTSMVGDTDVDFHGIDYGIDAGTIPRVSALSVLEGNADANRIAGKRVVVGASALELNDNFFTPNQGPQPGAMIQVMAVETEMAGRALTPVSPWWIGAASLVLFALQFALPIPNVFIRAMLLVAASLAVEAIALALYLQSAVVVPTGVYHVGTLALIIATMLLDTRILATVARRLGGERDTLRSMLEQVVADNYDGVIIARASGEILLSSRFAATFFGHDLIGRTLAQALPPAIGDAAVRAGSAEGSVKGETQVETAKGQRDIEFVLTASGSGTADAEVLTVTFRDITQRRENEAKLRFLASHDPMTGILSRAGFLERLTEAESDANAPAGVFVIQLERFTAITASLGHETGDAMLRQFAGRLTEAGFAGVAHLGLAQFAISAGAAADPDAQFTAILKASAIPFVVEGHTLKVGLSGGYAASGPHGPAVTLRWAEAALVSAASALNGRLAHYDEGQVMRITRTRKLESQLSDALNRGEFMLVYQPQIALGTGAVIGAEALVRWKHAGKVLAPDKFLPIAEETGMIVELTRWILKEACLTAMGWPAPLRVAVNISAVHFQLGDLAADVMAALACSGLPADRLELEITETAAMTSRLPAADMLARLRALGVTIAIDDFGTGQSSLAYLDQLPFDILKIDKSFVDGLLAPQGAGRGIISGIISIARTLDKRVLAEGVETADQAEMLAGLGCDMGQGYYWSRPVESALIGRCAA